MIVEGLYCLCLVSLILVMVWLTCSWLLMLDSILYFTREDHGYSFGNFVCVPLFYVRLCWVCGKMCHISCSDGAS